MVKILLAALLLLAIGCSKKIVSPKVENYVVKTSIQPPIFESISDTAPYPTGNPGLVICNIYFDFDKSDITEEAKGYLDKYDNTAKAIAISGHCDDRGADDYNMALGQSRADETRDYLVSRGIPIEKIKTESFGKRSPIVRACITRKCHAGNRRAVVKITF